MQKYLNMKSITNKYGQPRKVEELENKLKYLKDSFQELKNSK